MTHDRAPLFVTLLCCGIALLSRCGRASAQDDAVIAARVCFSESRFDGDECRAIVGVLAERSVLRGTTVRAAMYAYSPRATGRRPYGSRSWIAALHPDRTPSVEGVSRELVRVRFAALTVVAWEALRGIGVQRRGALHWSARHCRPCWTRMRHAHLRPMPWNLDNVLFGVAL